MAEDPAPTAQPRLQEDFEDFFENRLIGFIIADATGRIERANLALANWTGYAPADLAGKRVSDLLPIGMKIYYETHLAPLLRMQGHFSEVSLELSCRSGARLPVLVTAYERRDAAGKPLFIRISVSKAGDRRQYEQNLRHARDQAEDVLRDERETSALREQFIAVLGHDLRNPLSGISAGAQLLGRMPIGDRGLAITEMIQSSVQRMSALIEDVMDFARGRLGSGISVTRVSCPLDPILRHVVDELQTAWPSRSIAMDFDLQCPVLCDPARLSQLLSNILANALTHGAPEGPITVRARSDLSDFELSVSNSGQPIPAAALARLFQPFTREDVRASQNGLGLGLYISSEIARAHGGTLTADSNDRETRFTLTLPNSG